MITQHITEKVQIEKKQLTEREGMGYKYKKFSSKKLLQY